ncbi:MAG: VanR-ABDEGLN family response regulator transcription factor [Clostridia bacterium]|nr:VanR-ABDEGLN family response regulator transcription factor [Clostridia bacterium]MBQ7288324.1 VanR-ABDEGLN family response regulator transcription factor [Clostridia bacterium]
MCIIIVDDEKEIADLVDVILKNEGYETLKFYNSVEAFKEIQNNRNIDLAVLDVMMPGMDGFELCAKIRESHTYPIIMLTARVEDVDKITGLSIGADDYVTKPFNPLELLARVKAQLRRYKKYDAIITPQAEVFESNGLVINKQEHTVSLFEENINLTPTEFDILWLLCENAGNVVSSESIFEAVWKEDYLDSNNTVMVHIRRIREKLKEPPRNPKIIKTVWGVGYKIEK